MMTKKTPVIMKHPKLYTKNEKGRYEEYQIPDMDVSDTLFRRINGKYLKELMMLDKVSDLKEMPNLAELGDWHKCANYVLDEIGDFKSMTMNEIVYAVVGKVFEYSKKSKGERK